MPCTLQGTAGSGTANAGEAVHQRRDVLWRQFIRMGQEACVRDVDRAFKMALVIFIPTPDIEHRASGSEVFTQAISGQFRDLQEGGITLPSLAQGLMSFDRAEGSHAVQSDANQATCQSIDILFSAYQCDGFFGSYVGPCCCTEEWSDA